MKRVHFRSPNRAVGARVSWASTSLIRASSSQANANDKGHHLKDFRSSLLQVLTERGDEPALVIRDSRISFSELEESSREIGAALRERWSQQTEPHLPLLVDNSVDSYLAVFSCLSHRIPFALIDGFAPESRIQSILKLLQQVSRPWVGPEVQRTSASVGDSPPQHDGSEKNLTSRPTFIITTSGSTGQPKGVELSFDTQYERAKIDLEMREASPHVTNSFSPLHFIGGLSRLSRVFFGHTLHVIDPTALSVRQILRYLELSNINVLHLPPQLARVLAHYSNPDNVRLPSVKLVRMGSEGIRFETLQGLRKYLDDDVIVRHSLGATEGMRSFVNLFRLGDSEDEGLVPIGQPTDRTLLVPVPSLGPDFFEVYTGEPIAEGYINNVKLTEERFVTIDGARFWRSGDHVRKVSPELYFHAGRSDDIVKVRGILASPSETTAVVMAIDGVRNAITLPFELEGNVRLVSHVELAENSSLTSDYMRSVAATKLPAHLVPQKVFIHRKLPVNVRGKIDREALKAFAHDALSPRNSGNSAGEFRK